MTMYVCDDSTDVICSNITNKIITKDFCVTEILSTSMIMSILLSTQGPLYFFQWLPMRLEINGVISCTAEI